MDFPVAPFIVDAVRKRVDKGIFGYTKVPSSYYDAVVDWFGKYHDWHFCADDIQPIQGIVPACSMAVAALTEPGDKVVFFTPAYNCFFHNITNPGATENRSVLYYDAADGLYKVDFEDFERRCADPATKAFLLCNPHNPCGRLWTREELVRMGEICLKYDVKVISDEIHCEIAAPGTAYTPFASISEEFAQNCVSFTSPTKPFSIPGLQIANMITKSAEIKEKMMRVINIWEHCDVNQIGIVALQAAYSSEGHDWLCEMNEVVNGNFKYLRNRLLAEYPALRISNLQATYLLWIDFSTIGLTGKQVEQHLLENQKLWINAGDMYGDPLCCRINLACPRTTLEHATDLLITGLKELKA